MFSILFTIASAPILTEADLIRFEPTCAAASIAPFGNPESYPSDAELAAMRMEADAAYNAQFPPCLDTDDYPTLAERLAADMRYESKRG